MVIKKDIEVLPAETKELKLGWTVSETIGVAIVNPRAMGVAKALPKYVFENAEGGIDIRKYSIELFGRHEAAAKAMAEELLKHKTGSNHSWNYMGVVEGEERLGQLSITLTQNGLGLIDPEVWAAFKKNVEKMCNDLKAFL
jgi:hypothetical protein